MGIMQVEATQIQYIFCFLLINLTYIVTNSLQSTNRSNVFTWLLLLTFCIFAFFDTDYFSFAEGFFTTLKDFRDPLYYYISLVSFNSYSVFRFIIWGSALYLFYKTIKVFGENENSVLFIFAISSLPLFAQMRGSLGLALYCLGLAILIMNKNHNTLTYIWGFILICLSYFGHRSMIVPIILTPLIFIKPNRLNILLFLGVSLIIGQYVGNILSEIAAGELVLNASSSLKGAEEGLEAYAAKDNIVTYNWKYTLTTELRRHTYTVLYIYCLWVCFFSKKRARVSQSIKRLMFVCSGLFALGISILWVGHFGATLMGERFLYYLGIPLCFVLAHIRENGICKSHVFYLVLVPGFLFIELFIFGKILSF